MNDTDAGPGSRQGSFGVILAAVDGSQRAPGVLRVAVEIARGCRGRVHLYRAIAIPPDFPAAAHSLPDDLPAVLVRQARLELEALAAGLPEVTVEESLLNEPPQPWRAILDAGARLHADLIVIGSHGYSGWDHVLGTTAARVVNHATRSVLVVHEVPPPSVRRGDSFV